MSRGPLPLEWHPASNRVDSCDSQLRVKNDMYSKLLALFSIFSYPYNFIVAFHCRLVLISTGRSIAPRQPSGSPDNKLPWVVRCR